MIPKAVEIKICVLNSLRGEEKDVKFVHKVDYQIDMSLSRGEY